MENIWNETDLEPDDVLAIYILQIAKYYVVGEGNANKKYNRMLRYVEMLLKQKNGPTPVVIEGLGSWKEFVLDGKEFDTLESKKCTESYMDNFTKFASGENPVMFSFKPMRELVAEFVKNPDLVKKLVSNVTLYVYGGFNFRCLFKEHKKELMELINSFKKVCLYESYYVSGHKNSMNKSNAPDLYKYLKENDNECFHKLFRLTTNWNNNIRDEMVESIKKDPSMDDNTKHRHQKVIDSVTGNEDFQYVIADFGLAAVYDKVEPVPVTNLRFGNYTEFDYTNGETNIFVYKDIPMDVIEKYIIECLKKRFG